VGRNALYHPSSNLETIQGDGTGIYSLIRINYRACDQSPWTRCFRVVLEVRQYRLRMWDCSVFILYRDCKAHLIFLLTVIYLLPCWCPVTCQTDLVDAADRCYVIGAAFTLIGVNEDTDFEWFEPRSLLEIKEAMERGEFNNIDPDIVYVQFVSGNVTLPERGTFVPIQDGGGGETIERDIPVTWPWLMLGVGVMIFFFAIFGMNKCAVRRKERIEAENQSQSAAMSSSGSGALAGASSSASSVSTVSSVQTPQTKKIKSKKQKILDTVPENQSGDASSVESGHIMT